MRWGVAESAAALCALLLLMAVTVAADTRASVSAAARGGAGMDVLRRASVADREVPHQGVWSASWQQGGTPVSAEVDVVHRPGVGTLVRPGGAARGAPGPGGGLLTGADSWTGSDTALLDLLESNFWVSVEGDDRVGERSAVLVEARRDSGLRAARFWVDEETGLLLGSEVYDLDGALSRSGSFLTLRFDPEETAELDRPVPERHPLGTELDEDGLAALRADGWPLPERLDQGFELVEARSTGAGDARVAHLTYSDGICLVSVFTQRGVLDENAAAGIRGAGEAPVPVSGSGQHQRVWESNGFVHTVLADAPEGVVAAALDALPAPDGTGFWARVRRGIKRLGAWTA